MGGGESPGLARLFMPRTDLLALTVDDLAALTNRGAVKRAEKELAAGKLTFEFEEDGAGELNVAWSDGITCLFPAGETIREAVCSSGSVGISRHVVRSVLAYQRIAAGDEHVGESQDPAVAAESETDSKSNAAATQSWDPGAITDADLAKCFRKATVTRAQKRFDQGVLVELTRGAKPSARFLDEACTIRFLVPGDLRYVTGDCAEAALPVWVSMAVWAFPRTAGRPDRRPGEPAASGTADA